jgi:hypothetical protein
MGIINEACTCYDNNEISKDKDLLKHELMITQKKGATRAPIPD